MSSTGLSTRFARRARRVKEHALIVYFAARDPRTPWPVRGLALLTAAYALSPIDLIPDFIPVLGYLDDLVLIPLGLALVVRWAPADVLSSAGARAEQLAIRPVSYAAAVFVIVLRTLVLWVVAYWFIKKFLV